MRIKVTLFNFFNIWGKMTCYSVLSLCLSLDGISTCYITKFRGMYNRKITQILMQFNFLELLQNLLFFFGIWGLLKPPGLKKYPVLYFIWEYKNRDVLATVKLAKKHCLLDIYFYFQVFGLGRFYIKLIFIYDNILFKKLH